MYFVRFYFYFYVSCSFVSTKKTLVAKLLGRPDAGISELNGLVFEKLGRSEESLNAIKE